jgi:hypothetical protein
MSALERELLEKFNRLDTEKQRKVLEFVRGIEKDVPEKTYTARELMKLPREERNRLVIQALERTANDDVELFEAFDEADFDDE